MSDTFETTSLISFEKCDRVEHQELVLCTAIRFGGRLEWSLAWNVTRSQQLNWPERRKMLKAMSCTQDIVQIRQLATRVLHPNIKQPPKETLVIMKNLVESSVARPIVLEFLLSDWDFLEKQ